MLLVHLADLHIGKQVNGFSLIEDQRFVLESVLSLAKARGADAILLAGDLYDKSSPSAEAVALLDWFFTEIVAANIPCFAVPGNHDSSERVAYVSGLLERQGIFIAPVFDGEIARFELADEHGPVTFWLIPFLKPVHVRPHFPEADIAQSYTEALRSVVDALPLDPTQRNVALAHQFVTAGSTEPERSDSELSVGGLDNVDASIFDAFDYVALGHIHRPQRIGRDTVRYAGSPLKYSFSEIRYPKSVPLIDLGPKGATSIELAPLTPLHDMREIKGPLAMLISPDVVAQGDPNDYIHAVLTDEHPVIDALARIRQVYPNTMAVDYDNARTRAGSSHTQNAPDVEKIEPIELFHRFFTEQNGSELTENQKQIAICALQAALGGEDSEAVERTEELS